MEENKKYRILGTLLYYILRIISFTLRIEIVNKYNIDSFIKSINNRFNVCISLNGLFLHQVTAINSLIEIIIKYRKEIRYA